LGIGYFKSFDRLPFPIIHLDPNFFSKMTSTRPNGLTILGLLAIVGGAIAVLLGLINLGTGIEVLDSLKPAGVAPSPASLNSDHSLMITGAVNLVAGIINLLFGFGALKLQVWAWWLGIIMQIFGVAALLASFFTARLHIIPALVILIIYSLVLYYLFQPSVKHSFRSQVD